MTEKESESTELTAKEAQALAAKQEVFDDLVPDQKLMGVFESTLDQLKEDREEISETLADFLNMVMNDGDSTAASKEAVVNLLKMKTDTADKIIKIADLMTRIKLKERNTFPKYLAPQVTNQYNFGGQKSEEEQRQALLAEIDTAKGKKK